MNISSTPFIRNDYWPDYNDINQLNQRIDDVESEISLINIRLSTDIENVSNNLNSYAKDQADTSISNNIIVNNLNANYAEGRFANFDNTFTNNAYVENLTVNKPVFDITLNTPHLENTTSLGGNFYNANLFDAKLSGDVSGNLNNVSINDLLANNANISNLYVNVSPEPVQSSAVLGYDGEGRVIPVRATYDVGLPENADYLWTDQHGTAFSGVKATEVGEVENLITAYGVKNAIDALNTEVVDNFNSVNDNLNNVYQWQSSFENSVASSFNGVANNFNDVNNTLNDVNNALNEVNTNIENSVSTLNNTTNNISNSLDSLISILEPFLGVTNVSGWVNSTSPLDIRNITEFRVAPLAAPTVTGSDVGNGAKLNLSGTIATLGLPSFQWTTENMSETFAGCSNLNQNILIPNGVVEMSGTFRECHNLNQNILIPNGVVNMTETFIGCTSLNQNILIPNSVVDMNNTFNGCHNLNQNILIPNSVVEMFRTFIGCSNLNQNIQIPNSVVNMADTFVSCSNLNQNILIPNSVVDMSGTFASCYNLNQNILIPNSVTKMSDAFETCSNLNQNILIPNSVVDMYRAFSYCSNFNQPDIYIYSQNINRLDGAFRECKINNVHIPTSVPKSTSNFIYNGLVKGATGIPFPAANIFNDLPVDIEQWPPV